jgi:hypothetical protein
MHFINVFAAFMHQLVLPWAVLPSSPLQLRMLAHAE